LLPLYEQTQQYQKAAQCAHALTEIYVKMGDGERATRYGELILSYQQKAQESGGAMVMESPLEATALDTLQEPSLAESPASESQVREIDLSTEWASLSESGTAASAAESTAEEIEFYLQAGLATEAAAAIERLRESSPDHASLRSFDDRLNALLPGTTQFVEDMQGETLEESVHDTSPSSTFTMETPAGAITVSEPESETPAEMPAEIVDAPQPAAAPEKEADLVLDDVFHAKGAGFELSLEDSPVADHAPPVSAQPAAPARAGDRFASLAGNLDVGMPAAGAKPGAPPAPEGKAAPAVAPGAGFLDDIFAEFKEDVGESSSAGDDDIETHYNMGVAFKEMALYDEAIGEFQKVHQLAESAKDYSHIVQCCSLLATCFLGKGMPELAVQWYQTAINSPGVDAESSLALLYEMGTAQETAGDRPGALKSFKEVYGRNIDYRNVADRIRDLQ
jgi:tetratricopeptide (TPR) repeat protein